MASRKEFQHPFAKEIKQRNCFAEARKCEYVRMKRFLNLHGAERGNLKYHVLIAIMITIVNCDEINATNRNLKSFQVMAPGHE
jgi:hypothetical protein